MKSHRGHTIFNVSSFRSKWNIDCKCLWICPSAMIVDSVVLFFIKKITIFPRYVRRSCLKRSDHIFVLFSALAVWSSNWTLLCEVLYSLSASSFPQLNGRWCNAGDCRQSRFFCLKWISFDFLFWSKRNTLALMDEMKELFCVCACRVSSNGYIDFELLV